MAMSDEHKAALAIGRRESAAVRRYLEALEAHRPKRGRKRTPESITAKIDELSFTIDSASGITRLEAIQQRKDLRSELEALQAATDISDLEAEFVEHAKGYADRKGIEYSTFREFGVPADVCRRAGLR